MNRPHSAETNIAVFFVLVSVIFLLVLFNHADALGSPFGVICGWFFAEIVNNYRGTE